MGGRRQEKSQGAQYISTGCAAAFRTVPIGLAVTAIGLLVLPQTTGLAKGKTFDWLGALLLMPALIGLVLALNQVTVWGFTSLAMILTGAATAVLFVLLTWHELRTTFPLVNLRVFANPVFACGVTSVILSTALLYGTFFIVSFGLVRGYHRPVELAGLRMALIPITIGLVAPFSGVLADKVGARLICVAGMGLCIVSLMTLAIIATEHQADVLFGAVAFVLFGAGLGLFITPNNHRTINAAPTHLAGEAGALVNLMRVLGGCLGVASASSMLSWQIQIHTGTHSNWAIFEGRPLLQAIESGFAMLMGFAVVAALLSLAREPRPQP